MQESTGVAVQQETWNGCLKIPHTAESIQNQCAINTKQKKNTNIYSIKKESILITENLTGDYNMFSPLNRENLVSAQLPRSLSVR